MRQRSYVRAVLFAARFALPYDARLPTLSFVTMFQARLLDKTFLRNKVVKSQSGKP